MKKLLNTIGILSILHSIIFIILISIAFLSIDEKLALILGILSFLFSAISIALFVLGIIVIVKLGEFNDNKNKGLFIATGILSILTTPIATSILAYISLHKIK